MGSGADQTSFGSQLSICSSLHHKNLQAVTYVTGDVAGRDGSPVYG